MCLVQILATPKPPHTTSEYANVCRVLCTGYVPVARVSDGNIYTPPLPRHLPPFLPSNPYYLSISLLYNHLPCRTPPLPTFPYSLSISLLYNHLPCRTPSPPYLPLLPVHLPPIQPPTLATAREAGEAVLFHCRRSRRYPGRHQCDRQQPEQLGVYRPQAERKCIRGADVRGRLPRFHVRPVAPTAEYRPTTRAHATR